MSCKVNELCRRAVKENNLTALRFLLQGYSYPNLIELVTMSIKRSHLSILRFLLRSHPTLDCSAALACAVKQNNLTVIKLLLCNPISSVNEAVHLAYKYVFTEALTILMAYKNKYLSDLKEPLPTFVIEHLIRATLLKGDAYLYKALRHQVDTDGLLLFLARHNMKEAVFNHISTVKIKNHRHVSRHLLLHPDRYYAQQAAYGSILSSM